MIHTAETPVSTSRYIRNEYQWDRMSDVDWSLLRNNLRAKERILSHPENFPNADFTAVEHAVKELSEFLYAHTDY